MSLEKLLPFGFAESDGEYTYSTSILDGQFGMTVIIAKDSCVSTKVVDSSLNEEYVLHRALGASGTFVGSVRTAHDNVLRKISEECFEQDIFKSDDSQKVIRYTHDVYHDELEFLWRRFPNNAVFRRRNVKKWYAVTRVQNKIIA